MSDQKPHDQEHWSFPPDIPLIHGPVTPEEQARIDLEKRKQAKEEADYAFQKRQVEAVEASNRLARKSIYLTLVAALAAAGACGAAWYQGIMSKRSWIVASSTLEQVRTDSQESSKQFQVQLGHYDAGLGVTQLLAQHAGEQSSSAEKTANATTRALTLTQDQFARENRAYLIPVDTNLKGGAYGLVKISLRNYGRVSARNAKFIGSLDRISAVLEPALQESIPVHLAVAKVVVPSDVPTYTWDVFTPNFGPGFPAVTDTLRILGTVSYDDGFGKTDTVGVCYDFQVVKNEWKLCDGDTSTYVTHQE